jgi:hypothetical protein
MRHRIFGNVNEPLYRCVFGQCREPVFGRFGLRQAATQSAAIPGRAEWSASNHGVRRARTDANRMLSAALVPSPRYRAVAGWGQRRLLHRDGLMSWYTALQASPSAGLTRRGFGRQRSAAWRPHTSARLDAHCILQPRVRQWHRETRCRFRIPHRLAQHQLVHRLAVPRATLRSRSVAWFGRKLDRTGTPSRCRLAGLSAHSFGR